MNTLTNIEKLRAIDEWQCCPFVHPLTCGNEKCRADLRGEEREPTVILTCDHCDYTQESVPGCVYEAYAEGTLRDLMDDSFLYALRDDGD